MDNGWQGRPQQLQQQQWEWQEPPQRQVPWQGTEAPHQQQQEPLWKAEDDGGWVGSELQREQQQEQRFGGYAQQQQQGLPPWRVDGWGPEGAAGQQWEWQQHQHQPQQQPWHGMEQPQQPQQLQQPFWQAPDEDDHEGFARAASNEGAGGYGDMPPGGDVGSGAGWQAPVGGGGDGQQPWWVRLPDFVPVAALKGGKDPR